MALTLHAVLDELDRLSEAGALDEIGRDDIVDSVARAALLGARGNSGVILSQLIRGAAEELASRPGELVDPVLIGAAMARAAEQAYGSVREPAEGTILTVVREMASRIATELAHMGEARLDGDTTDAHQDALIAEVLERALETGMQSVERGPELLPVLREAGVVDAGGYGLTVLFAGVIAALRGSEPPEVAHDGAGTLSHLDVADMDAQVEERSERLAASTPAANGSAITATAACGALVVVSGGGIRGLYESFGFHTLDGGATLNPSTYDLLAGIHAVPAEEVIVLPNSPNVFMAAERAAELSEKRVRVVRSG